MYSACPSVHVCLHAHTLTLLCQGLMIPKEFPCYILSFNGARITRYCLSYGVSHIMVTSPIFLIEQDTTAPVFSHFHPDGNSLPMKPPVLISHHCSRLRLPSQGSAGTLIACQFCQGAGSWWDFSPDGLGGMLLHTNFHLLLGISGSEPTSPPILPELQVEHRECTGWSTLAEENELRPHFLM